MTRIWFLSSSCSAMEIKTLGWTLIISVCGIGLAKIQIFLPYIFYSELTNLLRFEVIYCTFCVFFSGHGGGYGYGPGPRYVIHVLTFKHVLFGRGGIVWYALMYYIYVCTHISYFIMTFMI